VPSEGVVFHWETSRDATDLDNIIPGDVNGTVQCDGYQAYRSFVRGRGEPPSATPWRNGPPCSPMIHHILITGALSGIGKATALVFAKEGAITVISGRREDAGQALEAELRSVSGQAPLVRADVRHEDDIRSLVNQTAERFGRLDLAINNAATEGKRSVKRCQTGRLLWLRTIRDELALRNQSAPSVPVGSRCEDEFPRAGRRLPLF
jgi:hypothetical protein